MYPTQRTQERRSFDPTRTTALNKHACGAMIAGALLLQIPAPTAQADTFDVILPPGISTLYTDPYNGNDILRGGFSGLYPVPGKADLFYVVTDRGPAPDFTDADGIAYKCWAIPDFGPHLLTVRLKSNGTAKINDIIPFKRPDGGIISGLPTTKPATDVPFDFNLNQLPYDEDCIDAEGITIDPWGNFWVCDEYKPSVAMMSPNGTVLMRLVPAGTRVGTEIVPTFEVLPGVLAKRRNNRGFEGLAASSTGILYAAVQRPLNNPNRAAADANGNARLVAIDLKVLLKGAAGPLVRQYLYQMPAGAANATVTVSDVFSTGPTTMLIPERTTDKLFEVDVALATDITPLEDPATGKLLPIAGDPVTPGQTFEQLDAAEVATLGIVAVTKTVVLDSMMAISPLLEKIEGVCVVGKTIVLTYDNDFNVWEAASIPENPNPDGPFVQLELVGENYPKIFTVPMP